MKVIKHSAAAAEAVELAGTKGSSAAAAAAQPAMFMSLDECVNIGLDCIYSYESDEESELIVEMAQFLKKKCTASRNQHVREEIDDILDIMKAIRLLKRYNIVKTLHYFKVFFFSSESLLFLFAVFSMTTLVTVEHIQQNVHFFIFFKLVRNNSVWIINIHQFSYFYNPFSASKMNWILLKVILYLQCFIYLF